MALRRLLAAFPVKKPGKRAYLDEATPKQLYDRCAVLGWDLVIQAGKTDS
jgi:hypothetical protein